MSRGPGRIERAIEALFVAEPGRTFSTDELVEAVYRGVNRIEKKHRVVVLRAANKVAERMHWAKWQCERLGQGDGWGRSPSLSGRGAVYVNLLDVRSYALGNLLVDHVHADKSVAEIEAMLDAENAKDIAYGGVWWFHVEEAKAKLLGCAVDPETQRMIDVDKEGSKQFCESLKAISPHAPSNASASLDAARPMHTSHLR